MSEVNVVYEYINTAVVDAKGRGETSLMYIVDTTIHDIKAATEAYHKLTANNYNVSMSTNYGMHIVDVSW